MSGFNLVSTVDDPSDIQLSSLMSQVRQAAHKRVTRVDNRLSEALTLAIKAKKKSATLRASHDA